MPGGTAMFYTNNAPMSNDDAQPHASNTQTGFAENVYHGAFRTRLRDAHTYDYTYVLR